MWHCLLLGECMEIDRTKLLDDAYRHEVLVALVQGYQDHIFRYCAARLGEAHGEEVAQEVFLAVWESLPKFRQDAAVTTWLFGIAKNKCRQMLRNRTRRQAIAHVFGEDIRQHAHAEATEMPEYMAVTQAQFDQLADCLTQLRDEERILLNLRYIKNLSVVEIAEVVGKGEAAVRKRLLRSLQRLRKLMDAAMVG